MDTFEEVVMRIVDVLDASIALIVGLGLVAFFWGLVKFLANSGESEQRSEGKKYMIVGILGMFIMVSLWAILSMITNTFDFGLDVPYL